MPASSCARVVAEADRCPCVERGCKGVWSAAYSASGGGSTKPRMLGRMHEFAPSEQQSKIAQRGYVEHHASSRMLRPLRLYLELLLVMHRPRHGTQAPHATGQRLVRSGSHQPLVMALAAQRPARPRSGSADVQHGSTLLRLVSMVPTVWSTRAELCRPPRNIQPGDRWSSSQERESLLPSIVPAHFTARCLLWKSQPSRSSRCAATGHNMASHGDQLDLAVTIFHTYTQPGH